MLKIYDSNHDFLAMLADGIRNVYTTDVLETGTRNLCFQVPCEMPYLQYISEENYVATNDYEFIIKEIVLDDNNFFTVYCTPNIEEISGFVFHTFDLYQRNIQQSYEYCLSMIVTWSVEYHSEDHTLLTIQTPNVTALEMIREIQAQTNQEVWFDTKNKVLHVYDKLGSSVSTSYYSNEIRLQRLSKESSTYDYATVLYPYGKDGLTISLINNNRPYLENYTYTNKRIEKIWINEDIDVAERLKGAAQDYLDSIAQPARSYKVLLSELKDTTSLGDVITIVDAIKHLKYQQRVVKIVRYPNEPERDAIELNNRTADFARTFIKNQKVTQKELKYLNEIVKELVAQINS